MKQKTKFQEWKIPHIIIIDIKSSSRKQDAIALGSSSATTTKDLSEGYLQSFKQIVIYKLKTSSSPKRIAALFYP